MKAKPSTIEAVFHVVVCSDNGLPLEPALVDEQNTYGDLLVHEFPEVNGINRGDHCHGKNKCVKKGTKGNYCHSESFQRRAVLAWFTRESHAEYVIMLDDDVFPCLGGLSQWLSLPLQPLLSGGACPFGW